MLFQDFIDACESVLSSHVSTSPHNEALHLLGSLLNLPQLSLTDSALLNSSADSELQAQKLQERVVSIVFKAALKEPARISRCLALYQVGMILFSKLWTNTYFKQFSDGLDILLSSLQVGELGSHSLSSVIHDL